MSVQKLRSLAALVLVAVMSIVTACGGGGDGGGGVTPPPVVQVGSVTVTIPAVTLQEGATATAIAEVRSTAGAALTGRTVTWTTSSASVASVSDGGVITGVSAGTVTITASSEGRSGTAGLTVIVAPVNTVTLTLPSPTLITARTMQAVVVLRDERNATLAGRPVTWTSSNPNVATVSGGGLVTGVSTGTTTIVATAEGKSATAEVTVVLPPVNSVLVTLGQNTIEQGNTTNAQAVLRDDLGATLSGRTIVWSSANPQVATVSAAGVVTGIAAGSANIVATSEGRSGTASVTVTPVPVASVIITGTLRVKVGDSYSYTVTARAANGTVLSRAVTWGIRESGRATITQDGVVVPQSAGAFTIVATIDGAQWDAPYTAYDWLSLSGSGSSFEVLEADAQVSNRFGTLRYPELVMSCGSSGDFFLWVRTPHIITQNGIVAFSFDGGNSVAQTWGELSPDFNTLWKEGSNATIKSFASNIALSRRFNFAFGEFNTNATKVAQFRVTGLGPRLVPLLAQCPAALRASRAGVAEQQTPSAKDLQALETALGRRDAQLNAEEARRRAEAGPAPMTSRFLSSWPAWSEPQQNVAKMRRR